MVKRVSIFLGIIQVIISIGAIPAGLSMIIEPNGSGVGMSTEVLLTSPFQDFFLPGIFLLIVNGLFNAIGAFLSFTRNKYAGIFGLMLGIILLLWISIQVYFIGLTHFLQPLFFVIGIIEIVLGYYFIFKMAYRTEKKD
jgi:hypothetical protein